MNKKPFQKTLVLILIFAWIFSGWPQIFNFPPKIQKARAAAGVQVASGAFTIPTGTSTLAVTGTGFQPKAYILILTKNDSYDAESAQGVNNGAQLAIGMTDGTRQFCMMSGEEDGQVTSDVGRRGMADKVICNEDTGDANQTVLGEASHVSMDADGFTIDRTTGFTEPSSVIVHYIAFAGDDLTAYVDTADLADTVDTSLDVTAPSFQPDVVITSFIGVFLDANGSADNDDHSFSLGWAVNPARQAANNQFSMMTASRDAFGSGFLTAFSRFDNVHAGTSHRNAAIDASYEINEFDSQGFTVTTRLTGAVLNEIMGYMAINFGSNPQVYTVSRTARTATGDDVESGAAFQPVFLLGVGSAGATTTNTNINFGSFAVGIATSSAGFAVTYHSSGDIAAASETHTLISRSFWVGTDDAGLTDYQATLSSFNSNGWTINYSDAAGAEYLQAFLAIGASAPAGETATPPRAMRLFKGFRIQIRSGQLIIRPG